LLTDRLPLDFLKNHVLSDNGIGGHRRVVEDLGDWHTVKTWEVECRCLARQRVVNGSFHLERKSGKNFMTIMERRLQDTIETSFGELVNAYQFCHGADGQQH